jgi:hypothetical protein
MKYVVLILFLSAGLGAQTAAEYMVGINNELKSVQEASWEYIKATTGDNPSKAEKKRQVFLFSVTVGISNISAFPPFKENVNLRDSALAFLNLTKAVMTEDYSRVVNLEPIAETAFDAMEAFILARQRSEHRLAQAGLMMESEFKKFGDLYGVETNADNNPLAAHINEAGTAFNYYNNIYSLFFKNYKQEMYFLQAVSENDVSAADQNRFALVQCANNSLEELKQLPAYNNDDKLKNACSRLLVFYRDEASQTLSMAAQCMVDRDNQQKLKDAYDSKKKGERTAQDEKRFREACDDYYKRQDEFRKKYKLAEAKRQHLLTAWNKAGEDFVKKHVP